MNRITKEHYNSIVYLSHPYGNDPDNLKKVIQCQKILTTLHPENLYLNPVAMFAGLYDVTDYKDGLNMTLFLLDTLADEMLICSDDYMRSKGCVAEIEYCDSLGIPYKYTTLEELKKQFDTYKSKFEKGVIK